MSWKYSPLAQDQPSDSYTSDLKQAEKSSPYQFFPVKRLLVILLVAVNICLWVITFKRPSRIEIPVDYAKTHDLTTEWANFHWHTAYSPKGQNHTKSDMLWEQILPSHGFVAVDRQWADDHQWPVSMYLPSDHGKGVYLLEAYHQLHCLRILRKTFWEAVEQRPYTLSFATRIILRSTPSETSPPEMANFINAGTGLSLGNMLPSTQLATKIQ
ncbi:MAG: hypothetical protein ASARMPREDX12_009560 [Alectoria sarmentosa]|nr:MAG: hypothetical protein ASARMPREDX12_009560 [Alectoria sarmentosa]